MTSRPALSPAVPVWLSELASSLAGTSLVTTWDPDDRPAVLNHKTRRRRRQFTAGVLLVEANQGRRGFRLSRTADITAFAAALVLAPGLSSPRALRRPRGITMRA